ncbi:PIN domain-containing protein [Pseudomonas syringae]
MELRSRLLFLDTNIYEGKNFQFLTHSLGSLKRLVDEGEVQLLITEVTKGEVVGHIRKKVKLALAEVKALKKKAMILRNVPNIPAYGIFSDASAEEVSESIIKDFETFLDSDHVEMVSIDNVKPSYVFSRFFYRKPLSLSVKKKKNLPMHLF